MDIAITETNRRRKIQMEYNIKNNITPKTIQKGIRDILEITSSKKDSKNKKPRSEKERVSLINSLTEQMKKAAKELDFELAAQLRDEIITLSGKPSAEKRVKKNKNKKSAD